MVTWLNLATVTPNRIFLAPVLRWHVIASLVSPCVFWRDYVSPKYEPCGVMCRPNTPEMPLKRTKKVRLGLSIKQINVSFLCVCPVIDQEFGHHIVKVAVDLRGDSRVDPQTTLTML